MPVQSIAPLTQLGAEYAPLASGLPAQRRSPFEGMPFVGQPGFAGLAAVGMAPEMYRRMGQVGMMPMGVGHDQNIYDRMVEQQYTMQQMRAVQQAAEMDRAGLQQTMRGMAAVTGTPWGYAQRRAAQSISGSMVQTAPILADMMPEQLDQFAGPRGSAAVMARRLMDAGRYRLDPVTGRMGMSAESVSSASRQMFGNLFAGDNASQMHGLTAGQVGSLTDELQRRGLLSTQATGSRFMGVRGDNPRANTLRALDDMRRYSPNDFRASTQAAGVGGTSIDKLKPEDIDKLNLDPKVMERIRSLDTTRISRTVRNYASAISAVRDIFGDMGRPNAPMSELVAGLEALTMGQMGQIDPARMGMMARQTYNLSRQTGVTMQNAMMLQQHAGSRAQALGMEPIFAIQAAQGGLGFGGAYRAQGHAAHAGWGVFNSDQMQQMDTNLRVQASGSHMANRMAVAMRLADQSGGFQAGSEADKYVKSIRSGMDVPNLSHDQFVNMLSGARTRSGESVGVNQADIVQMMSQHHTNRDAVQQYNIGNVVRRQQGTAELHPFVANSLQLTLSTRLRDRIMQQNPGMAAAEATRRANAAAGAVSQNVTRGIFDMGTEDFRDTTRRNRGIGDMLGRQLDAQGMGGVLGQGESRNLFLRQTADMFYGDANRAIQSSQYRDYGNMQNVHALTNAGTLDEADRQQIQAGMTGRLQQSMTSLGQGTMLSRMMGALQDQRSNDPQALLRIMARTAGGVRMEDINRSLLPHYQKAIDLRTRYQAIRDQVSHETNPQRRQALIDRSDVILRELTATSENLARIGQSSGMFGSNGLSSSDADRAVQTASGMQTAVRDTAALFGGFGSEVSADEIQRTRGTNTRTDLDAGAVLVARQQRAVDQLSTWDQANTTVARLEGRTNISGTERTQLEQARRVVRDGAPTGGLKTQLEARMADMRRMQPGLTDSQARRAAIGSMQQDVGNFTPQELAAARGIQIADDDEARAVIRARRRTTARNATPEEIRAEHTRLGGRMSESETAELMNARLRAQRWGITYTKDADHPQQELANIEAAVLAAGNQRFDRAKITPAERTAFTTANGDPNKEAIDKYVETHGGTAGQATTALIDTAILDRRQHEQWSRNTQFWRTPEGQAFRDTSDMNVSEIEDMASRLNATPEMAQQYGTQAIDTSDRLRGNLRRLRNLAHAHAGGDMARLTAGHLSINRSTVEGNEAYQRVMQEVREGMDEQRSLMRGVRRMTSEGGRNFGLGDAGEARNYVMQQEIERQSAVPGADRDRVTREVTAAFTTNNISPDMEDRVRDRAAELGSETRARDIQGFGMVANLTDEQRSRISGIRRGTGNMEEVGLLYGQGWENRSRQARAWIANRMRAGGMSREAAMRMLRIDEDMLKGGEKDTHERRITAVQEGLNSNLHVRRLAGIDVARPEASLTDDERRRMASVRMGTASLANARRDMNMPADSLTPAQREAYEARRRETGDRQEAARLLGTTPQAQAAGIAGLLAGGANPLGAAAAVANAAQLEEMTRAVSVARRMTDADRTVLSSATPDPAAVQAIATRLGVGVEDLRRGQGVFHRLGEMHAAQQRRENVSATDLSRNVLTEYGFSPGQDLTGDAAEFARLMESPQGRDWGRQALDSQRGLRSIAERNAGGPRGLSGVDEMRRKYFETINMPTGTAGQANARSTALATFRRNYGFGMQGDALTEDGNRDWRQFESNMQFQTNNDLLRIGPDRTESRTNNSERFFVDSLNRRLSQTQQTRQADQDGSQPTRMEMSGSVEIRGNHMDMSGAWGGTRDSAVPAC